MSSTNGMGPLPADDTIPIQISDTVARGTVKPTYPVIQYPHNRETGGDAIANGFVYRGKLIPALRDKLVFGDITTGQICPRNRAECTRPMTATRRRWPRFDEIGRRPASNHRRDVPRARRERDRRIPGMGAVAGRGRVDVRFAVDNDGELYVLTKSDGVIRKVVERHSLRRAAAPRRHASAARPAVRTFS